MAELDRITIKGFKSISSVQELELRAINVVIGPNGSGKSNFIGVFSFLHSIREGRLQEYVLRGGGAEKLLHFGSKVSEQLRIHISFRNGTNQYELALTPNSADELVPSEELVYFWDKKKYPNAPYSQRLPREGKEAGISTSIRGIAKYVRQRLNSWRLYHFHDTSSTSSIKKTADVNDNRYLRPDGSNIAAFLYFLRQKHEASFNLIVHTIQRVAPFFGQFQLEPQRLNPDKILLEWRHRGSDAYFDASSLSDGTLRFIALATLFLQPEQFRPSVILVDEPELGLHPHAITVLASLVRHASARTQVVLSTQSPFLLDHFKPEDVLVADRVQGGTKFTRLESEKLSVWLEDYSLGELWEKNELGGRPSQG